MKRRPLSIRFRVMALTLLPMTLLALVLGVYFTLTRVSDTRASLIERGQSTARLMASAAEFGVLSGNTRMLSSLSNGPIQDDDVADILFFDRDFNLLYRASKFPVSVTQNQASGKIYGGLWHFIEPITTTTLPFQDNPEQLPFNISKETVGWVAVLISAQPTEQRERQLLLRGASLTLICLIVAFALANRFGRRITYPILGLTRVIERLQRGELDARASVTHTGELFTLAHGINRLAARVQESNLQFEYRVENATRRLTYALRNLERRNLDLQEASDLADEANRAKDEFLARMSHELRTPLTSVLGFTDLLKQTDLKSEQKHYVQIVSRTSELLLAIIDDILDFSRLESAAIELETLTFNPEQRFFDLIESHTATASKKGLELIVSLPPDMPIAIVGDPTRLSQIINNLLGNAIKFTERGEIQLEVRLDRLDPRGPRINIYVRDTGIGIPADRARTLFTAFNQADSSISRRFGGSGLGLAIAYRLVGLMGGTIEINSELRLGTEIHISLPLIFGECPEHTIQCVDTQAREILVYDQNDTYRSVLMNQLNPFSTRVRRLPSLEYLATLAADNTLLVIGVSPQHSQQDEVEELLERLRHLTRLPVLFLTYLQQPISLQDKQFRIGMKPTRPQELIEAMGVPLHIEAPAVVQTQDSLLPYPLKILVAEDNDFNRLLIRRLLTNMGAKVIEASNGYQVLYRIGEQAPDLILMDVHMPGMDGIEATRRVRVQHPDLPIIALTANVVPYEHQALNAAGITDLLLKPIDVKLLLQTLQEQCRIKTGIEATPSQDISEPSLQAMTTPEQLQAEVRRLVEVIINAVQQDDRKQIRSCAHQLLGLAGVYEMPTLEDCTAQLHQAAREGTIRELWQACYRMQRLASHDELE